MITVALDLDSTLNDLDDHWIKWINENHEPNLKLSDWIGWDFHRFCNVGEKVFDFLYLPGTFRNLGIREGARDAVEQLQEAGNRVIIVTAAGTHESLGQTVNDKMAWVEQHLPTVDLKDVCFVNNKELVRADVLVDDGLHNLVDFKGLKVVFDQPWNRDTNKNYPRAKDWEQVIDIIQGSFLLNHGLNILKNSPTVTHG